MRGLKTQTIWIYALPGLAFAVPTIPVYVYLPSYYAGTVGLGLTVIGTVLFVSRAFDLVSDPLIGWLSDRLRLPGGRRKPFIALGSIIAALSLAMLFSPPADAGAPYLLVWTVLLYLGWTLIMVPYTAWGAELSDDYHERSHITSVREGLFLVGILLAAATPVVAGTLGLAPDTQLFSVAALAILLGAPLVTAALVMVPDASGPEPRPNKNPNQLDFRSIARNRPFLRLMLAWFLNGLANGLPAVLLPLFLSYVLIASNTTQNMLIFVYFLSGAAAMPLWNRLANKFGKTQVWCGAMGIACAAFAFVPAAGAGDILIFSLICIVTGMTLGADMALPPAIQADVIDYDRLKTGHDRAGTYFAFWSMATKLAMAAAVGLAFPLLDMAGFQAGEQNSKEALLMLVLLYAALPVALKLAAVLLIARFPIGARQQSIIARRLKKRHLPITLTEKVTP